VPIAHFANIARYAIRPERRQMISGNSALRQPQAVIVLPSARINTLCVARAKRHAPRPRSVDLRTL